jgi:hypothetical protein
MATRRLETTGYRVVRPPSEVSTVVFVDVDGVLNIGIKDPPLNPLLLSTSNVSRAVRSEGGLSAKVVDVCKRLQQGQAPGGSAVYSELASDATTEVSEVLIGRLAEVLRGAGDGRLVVLTSSWREPRHRHMVERLEERISHAVGEPFRFDDTTEVCKDNSPAKRLACIGDYISKNCSAWQRSARMLVLDDFHINPLRGFSVEDLAVQGVADAEAYLKSRATPASDVSVLLLHPFDQWDMPEGQLVQIGSGLSPQDVERAVEFLAEGRAFSRQTSEDRSSAMDFSRQVSPPGGRSARLPQQQAQSKLIWRNVLSFKGLAAPEWVCRRNYQGTAAPERV